MKKLPGILFLVCLAAANSAKADAVISGSVSSDVFGGSSCFAGGGPASSLSLSCSDPSAPTAFSTLTAGVGDTSGSVRVNLQSAANNQTPLSYESALFQLSVTGTYMLTGGTGYGDADLIILAFANGAGGGGTFYGCTVMLDGQTQDCWLGGNTLDFAVPYNTPLNLDVELSYAGYGTDGDACYSGVNYDLSALTPTPEPATLLLLGTGLIPLMKRIRH